jgi:hypothetical protein
MALPYKDKSNALKTHDDGGFRIADHDPSLRFPTEDTLKTAIDHINAFAQGHELRPCPVGSECAVCFMTKASAESDLFTEYVEQAFARALGPLGMVMGDLNTFYSHLLFTVMLGMELSKMAATSVKEIADLERLFKLETEKKTTKSDENSAA